MATDRVPLMLISIRSARNFGRQFKGLGRKLTGLYPSVKYDLLNAHIELEPENFMVAAFFSALIWASAFGIFAKVIVAFHGLPEPLQTAAPLGMALGFFLIFFLLHIFYPKIIAKNIADAIDRDLVFAVRDMLIQVSSGVPVYSAMENIAEGNYAEVSQAFKAAVQDVRAGISMIRALENMALKSQSVFLKKTCWQMITTIRSGANVTIALRSIVAMLLAYHFNLIKLYNAELNFMVLIYLLISAVVPTLGVTVLIIFSVFGILGVTPELFAGIVAISFIFQIIMIGYIHTRRPRVYA